MATIQTLIGFGAATLAIVACNGSGGGSGDASASSGITGASATASASTTAGTTGESEAGSASASESESGVATTASETSGDTLKLDVGAPDGGFACGCEFAYVWVANHSEGTVSKIDTMPPANCGVYGRIQVAA